MIVPDPHSSFCSSPPEWLCELPKKDPWSTPFAEVLLSHLDLQRGANILDVACGDGIPAFYLAHRVGAGGKVLGIDLSEAQLIRSRAVQGPYFPWLEFRQADIRHLPPDLGSFDRMTGNLSFMFFRPDRRKALADLLKFLKPGGQVVLTFPSLGTFESLWHRIEKEMTQRGLQKERQALADYIAERPSAQDARAWLKACGLEKVETVEYPLEIHTEPGLEFLYHPLLRGGFLEDVYDCFDDPEVAEPFMRTISEDVDSFRPLIALRCVMTGWRPR